MTAQNLNFRELITLEPSDDYQTTLAHEITIEGSSPYSSEVCKVIIHPAESGGIVFKCGNLTIPATFEFMKDDSSAHTTSLFRDEIEIRTVEHLLSGLWGMGVDNAIIEVFSKFLPFPDASAKKYSELISEVGLRELPDKRNYVKILKKFSFRESEEDDRMVAFSPDEKLKITSTTSFDNAIGTETVQYEWTPSTYMSDISWARTFLRSSLDKGGKLWDTVQKLFPNFPPDPNKSPIIVYDDERFLIPLIRPDEPARHKILDFIGDMALLGIRVKADIILNKPGHRFTRLIAKSFGDALL